MSAPPAERRVEAPTMPVEQSERLSKRLFREVLLLGVLYAVYVVARMIAAKHSGEAFAHAEAVWRFERAVFLPNEASLQHQVLRWPEVAELATRYYKYMHFPSAIATLTWLFLARPAYYRWIRRVLVALTGAAMIGHLIYPLAPPRMMPQHGLRDLGMQFGESVYGAPGTGLANQYAAMPSLHIGWALLVAFALIATTRKRWSWLWALHAVVTVLVVVVTANHYWLDGIVAAILLGGALALNARYRPGSKRDAARLARQAERLARREAARGGAVPHRPAVVRPMPPRTPVTARPLPHTTMGPLSQAGPPTAENLVPDPRSN